MGSFSIWHWIVVFIIFLPAILGIFIFKQRPIVLRHSDSGITKTARLGWSWTYLYFGWLVPLFRSELTVALLHFFFGLITFGLWQILWSFLYNKQHLTRLLTSGWTLVQDDENYSYAAVKLGIPTSENQILK